jgi:hypothetical protein
MADFDPSTSRREKQKLTKKFSVAKTGKSSLYDSKARVSFTVLISYVHPKVEEYSTVPVPYSKFGIFLQFAMRRTFFDGLEKSKNMF